MAAQRRLERVAGQATRPVELAPQVGERCAEVELGTPVREREVTLGRSPGEVHRTAAGKTAQELDARCDGGWVDREQVMRGRQRTHGRPGAGLGTARDVARQLTFEARAPSLHVGDDEQHGFAAGE